MIANDFIQHDACGLVLTWKDGQYGWEGQDYQWEAYAAMVQAAQLAQFQRDLFAELGPLEI